MHKHIVGNVDGASSEGDATVQRQVQKHFDHLLVREAKVERPADVAAQGAFPSQCHEARHRAQTAAGQIKARTRPSGAPVVFAGDAIKGLFRLGRGRGPHGGRGVHILPPQLGNPLEQAIPGLEASSWVLPHGL
jgi:hypothetical protein